MKTLILTFAAVVLVSLSSISQIELTYSINKQSSVVANITNDITINLALGDSLTISAGFRSNSQPFQSYWMFAYGDGQTASDVKIIKHKFKSTQNCYIEIRDYVDYSLQLTVHLNIIDSSQNHAGIESISDESISLNVYPNPTIDFLTVSFDSKQSKKDIEVYSLSGEMVMLESNERQFGQNDIKLDVQHLPSGMYFVKVDNKTFKVNKL